MKERVDLLIEELKELSSLLPSRMPKLDENFEGVDAAILSAKEWRDEYARMTRAVDDKIKEIEEELGKEKR